jgi:hypothetical protein
MLRTIVVVAGRYRRMSLLLVEKLLQWPHTLVVLLVHGADACARARADTISLCLSPIVENSRLEIEQLDMNTVEKATGSADKAMSKYPTIKGLVVDVKAFPEAPEESSSPGSPSSVSGHHHAALDWAMRGAILVFRALRPYFAGCMRLLVLSSPKGVDAIIRAAEPLQRQLFLNKALEPDDLERVAAEFATEVELAETQWQWSSCDATFPCRSQTGWWLDQEGFSFTLLHALLCIWQRRHVNLCICACACSSEDDPDVEEAEAVAKVMSKPPSANPTVAGRLHGNGGERRPWIAEHLSSGFLMGVA